MTDVKLPDAVFEQLRYLLDRGEQNQWDVGDFIRDVWSEIQVYVPVDEQKKAHAVMIIQMADRTGADKSTIRSRESMSSFFNDLARLAWQPPFTYHQMRALKTAGPDDWEKVAEWAMDGGYNGQPASIDEIREHINGKVSPSDLLRKRLTRLELLARKIYDDPATQEDVRETILITITTIQDALDLVVSDMI